ncbi:energy-coupled thiamine transporter ThiT [Helicovermis profundi]|uniref:Energy-coupled thiamine transporter ThiT n=1 Tax=Helicovermis profundi TaxID=3065157 RepID=A0AAU9EG06_9FIRM|nr:energy-coupled thiamine transporter ThiT [Clostridia bacterium S502]
MKNNTRMLVEAGIMIALAYVLSLVKVFQMPNGGSITAGSMIPILIFAIRWGTYPGVFTGLVYGIIQFILGPKWSFHPISILFDYVIAFGMLGLAGIFGAGFKKALAGISLAVLLRLICHVISGVIVWGSYAPEGQSPLMYSIIYNASYLVPELILSLVIFALLYRPLEKAKIPQRV